MADSFAHYYIDSPFLAHCGTDRFPFRLSGFGSFVWIWPCIGYDYTAFVCSGQYRSRKAAGFDFLYVYPCTHIMCRICDRLGEKAVGKGKRKAGKYIPN